MTNRFIDMHKLLQQYRDYIQQTSWIKSQEGAISQKETRSISWLYTKDSLTERLKKCCRELSVEVITEEYIVNSFCNELDNEPYFQREVWLKGDGEYWIYAQTKIPRRTYQQFKNLTQLNEQPLGEIIFNYPLKKKAMFYSNSRWPVRKNIYYLSKKYPLIVTELFIKLPIENK